MDSMCMFIPSHWMVVRQRFLAPPWGALIISCVSRSFSHLSSFKQMRGCVKALIIHIPYVLQLLPRYCQSSSPILPYLGIGPIPPSPAFLSCLFPSCYKWASYICFDDSDSNCNVFYFRQRLIVCLTWWWYFILRTDPYSKPILVFCSPCIQTPSLLHHGPSPSLLKK